MTAHCCRVSFSRLIPAYALCGARLRSLAALLRDRSRSSRAAGGGRARRRARHSFCWRSPTRRWSQEEREKVKDIVAVVIDRSTSQTLGDRAAHDRAGPRRAAAPLRLDSPTSSRASSRRTTASGDDGTRLFAALSNGLADVPPDRLAGVIMVTDGVVHDIPRLRRQPRLPRAAACPRHRPPGRARPADQAARSAALRHRRQGPDDPRRRCMERGGTGSALVTVRRDGQDFVAPAGAGRRAVLDPGPDRAWRRRTWSSSKSKALPNELTPANNRAVVHDRGHPREAARAARLRRAACGRADLAQPPEVGRQRRPRPFHHPAPAGEAGRHADQRVVADRLPDPRAVPAEDQGIRPDHLRPLRQPERACRSTYFDNIVRYVREGGAVLVAAGPEFASDGSLAHDAARADHSRPARRAHRRGALQGRASPIPASAIRSPASCRARSRTRRPGASGCASSARRSSPASTLMSGAERPAAPRAAPRGEGPRRAAPLRSRLAVGARLPRRRAASRPAAPPRPLADEGAGARGGGAARQRGRTRHPHRAADHGETPPTR